MAKDRPDLSVSEYRREVTKAKSVFEGIIAYCRKRHARIDHLPDWVGECEKAWMAVSKSLSERKTPALQNAWNLIYREVNPKFLALLTGDTDYLIQKCKSRFPKLKAAGPAIEEAESFLATAVNEAEKISKRIWAAKQARYYSSKAYSQEFNRIAQMQGISKAKRPFQKTFSRST